ncbi:SDR family oxidoreductase [Penaeicola halotolerans]|uniref:SDR family oxidoreductase n=1 Tax=Penaeicola halotolerans TaxID=2793196 RepID=UPI001CF8D52A|nr:SDR family oxidoreductase [Penaeicola halotolerans]
MKELVVVTGGSKGIGKAIIHKFAAAGYDIVTCARNQAALNEMAQEVINLYGVQVHTMVADLSKRAAVADFATFIQSKGEVGVLVNNTGVFIPGQIHTEEEGSLEKMIETNLYSAYHLTRAIVPQMKARKSGHIFSMGSIAGLTAYEHGGSYAISKWAMLGFTKCLRAELKGDGIKVTSILPGATYTSSWEGVDLPVERFMKSEDVAEAVWSAYQMSPQTVVEEIVIRPQLGDI